MTVVYGFKHIKLDFGVLDWKIENKNWKCDWRNAEWRYD